MLDAPTESRATLYIINYLNWQREGQFTFDIQRVKLLALIAQIIDTTQDKLGDGVAQNILLGSETIIFDDVARISPDIKASLVKYLQKNTLTIGPWYIHPDGLLTSGESYIRNLLIGRADSERYGIRPAKIAFIPDDNQSAARIPQILRGFGINTVFMSTHNLTTPMPFNWQSPDGTAILMINYQMLSNPQQIIETQKQEQSDAPILWVIRTNSPDTLVHTDIDSGGLPFLYGSPEDFAQAVRHHLPDEFRPILKGDLNLQQMNETSGRFSARLSYKQDVMRLSAKLTHVAEPLFALSLIFGAANFPAIQKSLIDYSWRLLLQNMSSQTLAGAVNDDTYNEMKIRNRQVEDNSQRVIEKSLQGLDGTPYFEGQSSTATEETYITVWNLHGHRVQQVIELKLNLPSGLHPKALLDPDGEEQAFTWDSEKQIIDFCALVPSVAYAVYTLKISKEKTAAYNQRRTIAGRSIGSASGESLGLTGGRLDWAFSNGNIIDLLNYYDGGDAGDIWQYQEPEPDIVMPGNIVDVVQVEATPTYERLIFRNRMRIAPGLKNGKERTRGLRVLDLTTTATYYNNLPGVHFQTQFTNPAEDHRLRVHLRTGINSKRLYTDSVFGLSQRPIDSDATSGEYPLQSLSALYDKKRGLGLFTRGLSSVEAINENNQVTLALSLLRSVGWLNKEAKIQSASAQMLGNFVTEFMLMPLDASQDSANLLRTSMSYQAPLRAFQYHEKPALSRRSYLQIEGSGVLMSALKTAQKGEGLILRLINTTDNNSEVRLQADAKLSRASRLNLAEELESDAGIEDNQVKLTLMPHEIATVRLVF